MPSSAPSTSTAVGTPSLEAEVQREGDAVRVTLRGPLDRERLTQTGVWLREWTGGRAPEVRLDLTAVTRLDTAGAAFLLALQERASRQNGRVHVQGMSAAAHDALRLFRVPPASEVPPRESRMVRWGGGLEAGAKSGLEWLVLAVDTVWGVFAGAPRTRRVRRGAAATEAVRIGVDALPIVTLISFLVGVVIALQSAYQLRQFGANIFVANLIGVSMTRELGPLMTAIIIAGRSGAAIAAEVATMTVSEEIDALRTMGLSPVHYVVVPKFKGITLTMPCLTMYANLLGIFGGFLVAFFYLDISATAFFNQLQRSMVFKDIATGLIKSVAFAWLICLIAAHQGFRALGGAESVGRVTTSSVVSSIFWVIVADAVFSLLFYFGD